MKILHVLWSFKYGGAETMLVEIANYQSLTNNVEILIINNWIDDSLIKSLSPNIKITILKRPLKSRNLYYIFKLNYYLLFHKADIIHFHQDNIIRYVPVRVFKKNFCLTVHSIIMDVEDVKKYNHLFAISDAVKEQININCGLDSILIYNGVNIDKIQQREDYKENPDRIFRIVQISSLAHECKGQDVLLRAASLLINKYKHTRFEIDFIGDGNSLDYLQDLTKQLELAKHVNFLGIKDKEYIRENLRVYDLLVQPSYWEGFGLTVVEAMAAKVLALVSYVGGLKMFAQDEKTAFVFQKGDAEDCADMLYKIIHTPADLSNEYTKNANKFITDRFDISKTAQTYLDHYKQLAAFS